ncbi:immunoglobulin superfamily member 6 isoform X1 [Saccopteryx leptura]|uniref:immunoglobulin superfamily member 6 isoform X1 n=1 Tax=Saccopteryx leptura TaxID=249018 RepID=UPI00339CE976
METADAGRVALGLAVGLVLLSVGAADSCTVSVSQPSILEVDLAQAAVTVHCSFSREGCLSQPVRSLWFRFGAQQPEVLCPDGCQGNEADKFLVETQGQNRVTLTIHRPTSNDSAIYVCGIAAPSEDPQAKRTGAGTVLVVREKRGLGEEMHGLLVALVSLLSLYVAAVLVVFIILSRSKSNTRRNKETEDSQKKSARRVFQEIAQELYNKRHVGTSRQPVKRRERDREGEEEQEASTPICALTRQAWGFEPATSAFQVDSLSTVPPQEKDNTYENRRALDKYERP